MKKNIYILKKRTNMSHKRSDANYTCKYNIQFSDNGVLLLTALRNYYFVMISEINKY